MNYPLTKDKSTSRRGAYLYRGVEVQVSRTYSFNLDYCTSSCYDVPSMGVFATNPTDLKKRIDKRLDACRDIRIDEADSLVLWRALEAYRNNIVSDGFDAIESHYAPASLLLAKVMHASCDMGNSLDEGETVQTIYDDMMGGTS